MSEIDCLLLFEGEIQWRNVRYQVQRIYRNLKDNCVV